MSKHYTEIESIDFSRIQNGNEFIVESHERDEPIYKTFLTAIVKKRFFSKKIEFRVKTEFPFLAMNKYTFSGVIIRELSKGNIFEMFIPVNDISRKAFMNEPGLNDFYRIRLGDISKITSVK